MTKLISSVVDDRSVSVVIATLGLEPLDRVIERLNKGTVVPVEILICIPEAYVGNINVKCCRNVRIVPTSVKGQVAQRICGFCEARSPYVLQIDDDVLLDEHSLELLLYSICEKENASVGPKIYELGSGNFHAFLLGTSHPKFIEKLFFYVINGKRGYQPGEISLAGVNMGVPESNIEGDRQVDWLAGGCILHRRENLILEDFYPFKGKAYSEDIFHSIQLQKSGVKLYRCSEASVKIDFDVPKRTLICYFREQVQNYRVRKEIINRIGGSIFLLQLFVPLNIVRIIFRKFLR